ncbi:MAG TPA: beta-ketoacyl synthase N-terminal-like domain-containing protein [Rhizobiaceae bacterium]|nr:beta-ketoacyl synthase N-terminal-like domain-containing protein [Rhizobiaceae bacterium]
MRQVLVAGIGSTPFGRHADVAVEALAARAADAAIRDSGLDKSEIGALYLGNFVAGPLSGQEVLAGLVADELGLGQIPCSKTEGACASGGIAFRHAYLAIATGQCDVAIAVGAEKMSHAGTAAVTSALNCAMDNLSDGRSGLTFPGFFGMVWNAHAARYGTTREMVAAIVQKNKRNGLSNPLAQMGADLSLEQIAAAKPICDPLQLYDCCPISDGAAAALLVAADRANDFAGPRIAIAASAQTRGSPRLAGIGNLTSFRANVDAARIVYEQSGLSPSDIDLCELHDCFSIAEVVDSEDLGLVPRGKGAVWAAEGRTAVGGEIPINPGGGLLAKGHPVGATGLGQIYEIVTQLRGKHPNQVKNAGVGMTHNLGGAGVACTVTILKRTDA